ncbi:MAG: 23S rRNA (pseudouridine(1915)-N(3))-methyltransferase RlmH [Caulobacteraceae bacterium]
MRITLLCVGKLGKSAEAALAAGYAARATAIGRGLGLGPVDIVEVEGRQPGKAAEGRALLSRLGGARLFACDEGGVARTSRDFAAHLATLRDGGARHLAFAVGGADGLGEAVLDAAAECLAFGPQTWPHALARVMLAEQIYRAAAILAGSPYHHD